MFRHILEYFLLAILFLNYAGIIINTNIPLSESKESELSKYPSLSDNLQRTAQENKSMKISDVIQKTPTIDLLKAERRSFTIQTPPSTPPTGYIEKYVDTLTDYHIPSDLGVIYDWTKMQSYDFTYSQLSEGVGLADNQTYWHSPSSYENLGGALSNPEELYASDDNYAQANQAGYVTVYNFSLPDLTEATIINGIEVTVEAKKGDSGNPTDVSVNLLWNGRSSITSSRTNTFGATEEIKIYGGVSDTWERSWIGTDFTNNNFGVVLTNEGKIRMDHVQVKIYYTIEFFDFDREFSFEPPPLYDEGQELCIRTGTLANEDLNVDLWNSSASKWIPILNLQNDDSNTWKNVSLTPYLPNSNLHFRFIGGTTIVDATNDTWQIDAVLIKYKLIAPNFLYRRNITLDHTQVAAPLTNFPVLIDLYDRGLHDHAQVNGTDILFAHSSGIKLAHEIEYFNQTGNGTHAHLIAWVKVPILSNTSDTRISLYYGNITIGNQETAAAVWDDFLAVHHMEEEPIALISDSTTNHQNMTSAGAMTPSDLVDTKIGEGIDFDGTDDTFTSINLLTIDSTFTVSLWVQFDVYQTQSLIGINTTTAGSGTDSFRYIYMDNNNRLAFSTASSNFNFGSFNTGSWIQVFLVYNASTNDLRAYLNGTQSGSNQTVTLPAITELFQFASFRGADFLDGRLDEVRICKVARSAAWIATEYNNQRIPTNFYFLGPEEHMEDLDPPEIVAFGITDPGNGHPEFWANLTDDFSGVASVNITLNGTIYSMNFNSSSGLWTYQQSVNFTDYWTYQISNASDYASPKHYLPVGSAIKNVTFDYDAVAPSINEWEYFPLLEPNGTFNANVSDWGIIDTVIVKITYVNEIPIAITALMRLTTSGYINDTINFSRGTVFEYVIVVNDTVGNTNTSASRRGYVGANNAPSASNLALIPEPIHSNESLTLSYDYYDADGDGETTTEIRWYKNDVLQPALNDSSIVLASYLFKGDRWNVTVRPKDWKEFGDLQIASTTIQNTVPQATGTSLSPLTPSALAVITPTSEERAFILEDEGIKLDYIFFDADSTDLDQSAIYWYRDKVRQNQYTNLTTIPASGTTPGEVWKAEIIPSDGEGVSPVISSREITIESHPDIFGYGIEVQTTAEGYYTLWVNTTDVRNEIHQVDYVLTVEALNLTLRRFPITAFNGTSGLWVLENFNLLSYLGLEEDIFVNLLNTLITVNVSITTRVTYASTDYTIERALQFDFPITDEAPPRVEDAGIDWKSSSPNNITFWATLSEWGSGINEVLLYYDFRPLGAQTKFADLPQGPILMSFNGTHYLATVAFTPDQIYDILFQLSVSDLAGNTNADAYPEGWSTGGVRFTPPPIDLGPFLILFVVAIAIIGILAVVAVRVFRKTELVGVDINKVVETSQQVSPEEIRSTISEHTLGIVISTFDQLHGPIPLFVEPPILKDNFDKLIELSDRAFSAVRFVADFEREIFTVFEFDFGVLTTSISYGFSLDRPEARGGAENITLNIVIHNPYGGLVTKFADVYANDVHQIHMLMNKGESEKEEIANLVVKIRETITAIIVAYEELYGIVEEFEFD